MGILVVLTKLCLTSVVRLCVRLTVQTLMQTQLLDDQSDKLDEVTDVVPASTTTEHAVHDATRPLTRCSRGAMNVEKRTTEHNLKGSATNTVGAINSSGVVASKAHKRASCATGILRMVRRNLLGFWSRLVVYPLFYILYLAYFLSYFLGMITQSGSPDRMLSTATTRISIGARLGFLPAETAGGPPWLPGRTCLSLPAYYDLENVRTQRVLIPCVYACMHGALTALTVMPIPLCYATWTRVVATWPSVRHHIPIDDFVYVHRLLGFTAIGGVTTGAFLWLLAMIPSCAQTWSENACDAFKVSVGDGAFTNVLVLRLIVGPLWLGFLPLMIWADIDWSKVELALLQETQKQQEHLMEHSTIGRMFSSKRLSDDKRVSDDKTHQNSKVDSEGLCDRLVEVIAYWRAHWSVAPAVLWFSSAIGLVGASTSFYTTSVGWAPWIGFVIGYLCGHLLMQTQTVRRNWFEICYWSHMVVAYSTILVALIARFDVFWPCIGSWFLVVFDRCVLMRLARHPFYIQANNCRVVEGDSKTGRSTKLRLVLRPVSHESSMTFHAQGASNWIYLRVSDLETRGRNAFEKRVMRAWHPFSVAGTSNGNLELYIDVHGKYSWTRALTQAVLSMQREEASSLNEQARHTLASAMAYDVARRVEVCGPFGSSFSRCFQMKHRANRVSEPAFDIVILYGSGIGVPSAVSALREFIERRRHGTLVPSVVYFIWQARYAEDLLLCWDSLHRIIYEAGGLWNEEVYTCQRTIRQQRLPIDRRAHARRNGGEAWTVQSPLLEWLGVSLFVSQMSDGKGKKLLEADNSLKGVDETVHQWLTHKERLRKGRAPLSQQVVKLIAQYEAERGANTSSPRLCISMCGSPNMARIVSQELRIAQTLLAENVNCNVEIECELMADTH